MAAKKARSKKKSRAKPRSKAKPKTKSRSKAKPKSKSKARTKSRSKAKSKKARRPIARRTRSTARAAPFAEAAAPLSAGLDRIVQIAQVSAIARHNWPGRGVAPRGYIKGMALVFARALCKLSAGDPAAIEMAKANTGDPQRDALAHYSDEFRRAGMRIDVSGPDTLRHLFVLLIGLGMRESSGKHCEGRDRSASNTTAETCEAGAFQASFNARSASPLMPRLFTHYSANPSGFVDVFREGVRCSAASLENFGTGPGRDFQQLSKECPAFAAEFAAVGLRNIRRHWGPITRKEAQIHPDCNAMLVAVQRAVDTSSGICAELA